MKKRVTAMSGQHKPPIILLLRSGALPQLEESLVCLQLNWEQAAYVSIRQSLVFGGFVTTL